MPTNPNKKSSIREIMYLAKQEKDREVEAIFKQYGHSNKPSTEHQGIMFVGENALGMAHPEFTINGHGKVIYVGHSSQMPPIRSEHTEIIPVDEVTPMVTRRYFPLDEELGEMLDASYPTISRIDPTRRYFPPDGNPENPE